MKKQVNKLEKGGKQSVNRMMNPALKKKRKFKMNSFVKFKGIEAQVVGIRLTNTMFFFYDLKIGDNTLFSVPQNMIDGK